MAYHLNNVYRLILPDKVYPFYSVYIDLPPEEIDVNIHPAKREVKIRNENELCRYLRQICEQALMRAGQTKQITIEESSAEPQAIASGTEAPKALSAMHNSATDYDASTLSTDSDYNPSPSTTESYPYTYPAAIPGERTSVPFHPPFPETAQTGSFFIPEDNILTRNRDSLHNKLKQARYIGSFLNKYLIFSSQNSLLLLDQHAAQERITYEQLLLQMQRGKIEAQHLLTPVLIKLSPQELLFWEEVQGKLKEIGFENHQFDPTTIAIDSYPLLIKNIEQAIRHLLAGENIARCEFESIARRACRSSIMAGDRLNPEQAENQRKQLLECLDPFTCPHGRPIVVEMDEHFLDKQFKR